MSSKRRVLVAYVSGKLAEKHERELSLKPPVQATLDELLKQFYPTICTGFDEKPDGGIVFHHQGVHAELPYDVEWIHVHIPGAAPNSASIDVVGLNELTLLIASQYVSYDGFVIIFDKSSLADVGAFLAYQLEGLAKPVVFVDSLRPLFANGASDARSCLGNAIHFAGSSDQEDVPPICEVGIVCQNLLLRAAQTIRVAISRPMSFEGVDLPPLAHMRHGRVVVMIREMLLASPVDRTLSPRLIDENLNIFHVELPTWQDISKYLTSTDAVVLPGIRIIPSDPIVSQLRDFAQKGFVFYLSSAYPVPDPNWISVNNGITEPRPLLAKVYYILSRTRERELVRRLFRANLRGEGFGPFELEADILAAAAAH